MKDRNFQDIELFGPFKHDFKKKISIGAVSHRTLQADRPEEVAADIRRALKHIPPEQLVVSSDCGFGRQGCNREIAFYKASAIAQGQPRSQGTGPADDVRRGGRPGPPNRHRAESVGRHPRATESHRGEGKSRPDEILPTAGPGRSAKAAG